MTLDEILKSNELTDEQIDKIKEDMKANKVFLASEENLDIRYGKLKDDRDGINKQLDEANSLIEEMKKGAKDNEGLQTKISEYEKKIDELEKEKADMEKENALKIALLEHDVEDVDYLAFKVKEQGEIELDEKGNIKGIDETLENLKAQHPQQFKENAIKKIEPNKLEKGDENGEGISKEEFEKMSYNERNKLFNENPDLYDELTKES